MSRNATISGISALELELEEGAYVSRSSELGEAELNDELELGDSELDDELGDSELNDELGDSELGDSELDSEVDSELNDELGDSELEGDLNELMEPDRHGFAERFYELATTDHESELELEVAVDSLVREMEQEYFWKSLLKKGAKFAKKAVSQYAKGSPFGSALKAVTSLARGNLSGMLGSLAKTALSVASANPAFAAALPALKAIGFVAGGGGDKAPWSNLVSVAKDAYGSLANNVSHELRTPPAAQRAASRAFQGALQRSAARTARRRDHRRVGSSAGGSPSTRVITLRRGDRLVVRVR